MGKSRPQAEKSDTQKNDHPFGYPANNTARGDAVMDGIIIYGNNPLMPMTTTLMIITQMTMMTEGLCSFKTTWFFFVSKKVLRLKIFIVYKKTLFIF